QCIRGCTSISQLSHQYWDTYSQHGGKLRCTCPSQQIQCDKCKGIGIMEINDCTDCSGKGTKTFNCSTCNNERKIKIKYPASHGYYTTRCTSCNGREYYMCYTCDGKGVCNK